MLQLRPILPTRREFLGMLPDLPHALIAQDGPSLPVDDEDPIRGGVHLSFEEGRLPNECLLDALSLGNVLVRPYGFYDPPVRVAEELHPCYDVNDAAVPADDPMLQFFGSTGCPPVHIPFSLCFHNVFRVYEPPEVLVPAHPVAAFLLRGGAVQRVEGIVEDEFLVHHVVLPVDYLGEIRCMGEADFILPDGPFSLSSLGQVEQGGHRRRSAPMRRGGSIGQDRSHLPLLWRYSELHRSVAARGVSPDDLGHVLQIFGVNILQLSRLVRHLLDCLTMDRGELSIHVPEVPVLNKRDAEDRFFGEVPEHVLRFSECFLGAFSLRDIVENPDSPILSLFSSENGGRVHFEDRPVDELHFISGETRGDGKEGGELSPGTNAGS